MANWNNPTNSSLYTDYTTNLKDRDLDVAKMMDSAVVTVTNPTTDMKRWNSTNRYWEKWNGSTWTTLTSSYNISIDGTAGAVDWTDVTNKPTTLAGYGITNAQPLDSDLTALAGVSTTGLFVRTGSGTATTRSLAAPAAGITISNADGVAGNPTFALANDLSAVEGLATNGIAVRTATSSWTTRTIAQPLAGITVSNADGISGNPTLALANDLAAVEGLSGTGFAVRTSTDTWTNRSIAVSGEGLSITNANGVSGNPTISLSGGFSTGDVKLTFKSTADSGWVMMNDGTIGNASSGATTRANADTEALFTVLWNNITNTWAAVSGGRGASAAADFAASKTLALPKALGRALAVAGSGSGLTARSLGQTAGAETHTLATSEIPASLTVSDSGHVHTERAQDTVGSTGSVVDLVLETSGITPIPTLHTDRALAGVVTNGLPTEYYSGNSALPLTTKSATTGITVGGGGGAHNNVPPETFFNVMVKL